VSNFAKGLNRPIVLVGLMGAGKSVVGRGLAKRLGLRFIDCDSALEEVEGCSIAEIFERFGEKEFRDRERHLIERLANGVAGVIATGGGAFVDDRTRELLNRRALTVWLDASPEVLAERIGECDNRPLLRTADPGSILEKLHEERRPFYEQAHLRVDSSLGDPERVVDAIVLALGRLSGPASDET
jgi:shikimate kinase